PPRGSPGRVQGSGDLLRGFRGPQLLPGDRRERFDGPHPVGQVPGEPRLRGRRVDMAMTGGGRDRQRGLTLIETLLAMTLLGFGLLALWPLFIGSGWTSAFSNL